MERGQDGAQKLRVSFHGLFLESGRKGSKNKRKISTIVSSRERCIPWFKVLHFGISPRHTRAPEPDGLPEGEFLFAMDFSDPGERLQSTGNPNCPNTSRLVVVSCIR